MSGSRRSAGPVRQLSLQQPATRRRQIRRQRSAEDEKSLQIYADSIARGKLGANARADSERPKVRFAWSENRRKNEKPADRVEVVARQISGQSRPTTGKSRISIAAEKASILYSRQELAERLRLAWKHREENKANIDIFLTHTVEERCESELSNYATVPNPPTPRPKEDNVEAKNILPNDRKIAENCEKQKSINFNETCGRRGDEDVLAERRVFFMRDENSRDKQEVSNTGRSDVQVKRIAETNGSRVCDNFGKKEVEGVDDEEEMDGGLADHCKQFSLDVEKKTSATMDCQNLQAQSTALPLIKLTTNAIKSTKEEFSSAKQKRASFHSGTNRAFLGSIKSSIDSKCNSMVDKTAPQKITSDFKSTAIIEKATPAKTTIEKDNPINDKIAFVKSTSEMKYNSVIEKCCLQKTDTKNNLMCEKNSRVKGTVENKESMGDEKMGTARNFMEITCNSATDKMLRSSEMRLDSTIEKNTSAIGEQKDTVIKEKNGLAKNILDGKCNEKNAGFRKSPENMRIDQKSRRTNSAPPQRHLANDTSGNRLQVNIVIDTPNAVGSTGKISLENCQEKSDRKNETSERIDQTSLKISCGRSVRSAPVKKRTKTSKKRFWSAGTCKNDEDEKSRNKSGSRRKNSIDSRAIDVVTMVSLVSSADSDSDTENSPGDDKLISELRSKLPTTPIIKTSINSALNIARRPIKSVSFQKDSFDEDSSKDQAAPIKDEKTVQPRFAIVNNRGNGGNLQSSEETVSWRNDIPGLALPVLALIHDSDETLDVPLTDREKRCLAVPIGDLHDKKRKLLRTRNAPSRAVMEKQTSLDTKGQEVSVLNPRTEISVHQNKVTIDNIPPKTTSTTSKENQEVRLAPSEPHFQTNKEKECWHLYRKMCDKGVCVSFDTVLRGMLTPTEYRLRQKELMQDL